ncbi:hypothetical protein PUN28_007625 [Cardiocondyla obscurior]|uniref:Uncharacterized protein n=1 Tax=Cardiocondyla obscurior TaxID=286306 RepID=A0AAW2GA43_9HYME
MERGERLYSIRASHERDETSTRVLIIHCTNDSYRRYRNEKRTRRRKRKRKNGRWAEGSRVLREKEEEPSRRRGRGRERSRRAASRKSGREKKRMKIAVVKSTRVAPNAINR